MISRMQPMTLRRFVQVTYDNFRQLVQNIAAPTTTLPMPVLTTPSTDHPPAALSPVSKSGDNAQELTVSVFDEASGGLGESASELPLAPATSGLPLDTALESLLFVAEEPVEPAHLARIFGVAPAAVESALQELGEHYRTSGRGLRLQARNGRYQLVTAPEAAGLIEAFLNLDTTTKLSGPALEALAVVAYRQPVTRAQVEAVRGVDCSGVLRSLLQRGLIEETGRMDAPGRPVLYGVTDLFMRHFGLTALHELPPLETGELDRIDEILNPD